jgi:hypothetical protein
MFAAGVFSAKLEMYVMYCTVQCNTYWEYPDAAWGSLPLDWIVQVLLFHLLLGRQDCLDGLAAALLLLGQRVALF